jgi:hypothetical protein
MGYKSPYAAFSGKQQDSIIVYTPRNKEIIFKGFLGTAFAIYGRMFSFVDILYGENDVREAEKIRTSDHKAGGVRT